MKLKLLNGNDKYYSIELPEIFIPNKMNDIAHKHLEKYANIKLKFTGYGYTAKPKSPHQILKIIMRYNHTPVYYDNASTHNTLILYNPEDYIKNQR